MSPGEVITAVRIPRVAQGEVLRLYKVSKRHDVDISTFTAAVWGIRQGNVLTDVRIAYGGCGPMVVRLPRAEALLRGREMTRALFDRAGRQARLEITPISDVRGRADYRTQLAENVLVKFYLELSGGRGAVPVPQEM
jgi:xanthine dehydrogenase small subunit